MVDQTKIEWTDFTVNAWEGCQKVGPGCDHCYAEARDIRFTGGSHWGPGARRRKVAGGIPKLRKIQRDAPAFHAKHGHWPRVFCSSLSDVFDNAVDPEWRAEFMTELELATSTRPQLLTKRVGNVEKIVPVYWQRRWPQHIGLMITVVNQTEADRDIPKLLSLKANLGIPWVGLSMEPLLGPVDLAIPDFGPIYCANKCDCWCMAQGDEECPKHFSGIDWVIVGGESGREARPMHPDWARAIRDQCQAAGVPFLFKQWGEWAPSSKDEAIGNPRSGWKALAGHPHVPHARELYPEAGAVFMENKGKIRAGRLLDGRTWDEVPA